MPTISNKMPKQNEAIRRNKAAIVSFFSALLGLLKATQPLNYISLFFSPAFFLYLFHPLFDFHCYSFFSFQNERKLIMKLHTIKPISNSNK